MKAILVLNEMPVDCENCQLSYRNAYAGITCPALLKPVGDTWVSVANGERYELCPLKELPERKETKEYEWTYALNAIYADGRNQGWNDCLDAIEGKENGHEQAD